MESQKTVAFDDDDESAAGRRKRQRRRTKRELRAERVVKQERDRMALVLPDPVRDRERERNLVRLATKGVVQLFNAVAERQKKLEGTFWESKTSKKRRIRGLSPESFNRKLSKTVPIKDEADETKADWLSDDRVDETDADGDMDVKVESSTDDDLDTTDVKTEPESDSE